MALIEYAINRDPNGDVTVVGTIRRIDPGDQLILTSGAADTALQWDAESPFAAPAAGKIFPLVSGSAVPVQVVAPMDLTKALAQCGSQHSDGTFIAWKQGVSGFPNPGGTQVKTK